MVKSKYKYFTKHTYIFVHTWREFFLNFFGRYMLACSEYESTQIRNVPTVCKSNSEI